MNRNKDANAQDFQIMKQIDRAYGEKVRQPKPEPQKQKQRNAPNYSKMSVQDIMAMDED